MFKVEADVIGVPADLPASKGAKLKKIFDSQPQTFPSTSNYSYTSKAAP